MKRISFQLLCLAFSIELSAGVPSGRTLFLDGEGDFVRLNEPIITTNTFTIEAWANMFALGGGIWHQNPIFEQRSDSTGHGVAIILFAENQSGQTSLNSRSSMGGLDAALVPCPSYGEWHHYAGVVSQNHISLYIDGQLVQRAPNTQVGSFTKNIDFIDIGRHRNKGMDSGFFHGVIDELRIWDYARSAEQIGKTLADTLGLAYYSNSDSGLVGYWRFDELMEIPLADTVIHAVRDLSPLSHSGTLIGHSRLAPLQPVVHILRSFSLLEPQNDTSLYTTSLELKWQSASARPAVYPGEIVYTIYFDKNADFSTARMTKVNNDTTRAIRNLAPGTTYFWKVLAENLVGEQMWCSSPARFFVSDSIAFCEDTNASVEQSFGLDQNYPNPFNSSTTIYYELLQSGTISLNIINTAGQVVEVLVDEYQQAGSHWLVWDAADQPSGLYFLHLSSSLGQMTRKITLLK